MKISLVMATVGRIDDIARFLAHLELQTYRDFELIIVDSHTDTLLDPLVEHYQDKFLLTHIKINQPGVSRARNLGLKYATGEIIGFPDDDCCYPPDLMTEVNTWFESNTDKHGLIGRAVSWDGKTVVSRFGKRGKQLNRYDIWHCSPTFTMFHRADVMPEQPAFKEELGPGAGTPWGAAEDTQLLIDILDKQKVIEYEPKLMIFHPDPFKYPSEILKRRGYLYGAGLGYVMGKNEYPLWFFAYYLLRCIAGILLALLSFNKAKVMHYLQTFRGRLYGWRAGCS